MAATYQVNTEPNQLIFGSQSDVVTVINTGSVTVYVGDDSSVVASQQTPLDVGGSLVVYPGQVLWAATSSGTSTLTAINNFGDRFAYGQYTGRLLDYQVYDGSGGMSGNVYWDGTVGQQYQGVAITLVRTGFPGACTGTYTPNFSSFLVPKQAATFLTAPIYGVENEVVLPMLNLGGGSFPSGYGSAGGIFPVLGYGGTWAMGIPATTAAKTIGVAVYGLPTAPPYPIPWVLDPAELDTVNTFNKTGNAYRCTVGAVAASTTVDVPIPPMSSQPVQVYASYVQAGVGNASVVVRTNTSGGSIPMQTALVSTAGAGSASGFLNFNPWSTNYNFFRITTAAGVTLSSVIVAIVGGW